MALTILRTLQQEDKVFLVLNADQKSSLTHKDFEQVLEMPISFSFPEDNKTVQLSRQRGVPFVTGMPHAPISSAFQRLTNYWLQKSDGRKMN